jgi:hypothetical protein
VRKRTKHTIRRSPARLGKVVTVLAMSAPLVGAMLSMTASPANAETPTRGGDVSISKTGVESDGIQRCLDDSSLGLRYIPCNHMDFQRWHENYFADGASEFVNAATGNCMDDSPTYGLRMVPCNGGYGGYQKWQHPRRYELQNEATGLCLDYSAQYGLRTTGCNGGWGGYQDWFDNIWA